MWTTIKSKALAIMGALVGILAVLVMYFKGRVTQVEKERVEDALEDEKVASELSKRAVSAYTEGMKDESDPITRNGKRIS